MGGRRILQFSAVLRNILARPDRSRRRKTFPIIIVLPPRLSERTLIKRLGKDFREVKGFPEALQVGESDFDVAAVFPEELPACAAG